MRDLEKYSKILIKVLDTSTRKVRWVHFCYIERELYNRFMYEKGLRNIDMNEILCRWCKEDFNIDVAMSSTKDLYILKTVVMDFYKRAHPDLFWESRTDRQGWLRVWVTRKIKEDLNIYGEERHKRTNG